MKIFRTIVLCLLISASVLHAEDSPRKFIVSVEDWPPLEYVENGAAKGINIDVISRIMKRLDVPVEFQFYPFARSWMMAKKGKVDAISNISYQPERKDVLFYTKEQEDFLTTGKMPKDYLWNARYIFFMENHHESTFLFRDYSQKRMADFIVGVVKDYSYNKAFRDAKLRRKTFSSAGNAFKAMANGEVDLFPMEATVGKWMVRNLGVEDKIKRSRSTLFAKPYMLAFTRKSDYPDIEKLSGRFYEELLTMRASGEYESIYESYIRPDYISRITRPLTFVCEEWAPLEYMDGKEVKGVDAAVVDYIMNRLGIPYRIEIYPWSRAWMMAEKGKADAVLSVSYKKTREKVLFYTEDQKEFGKSGKSPENYLWMSEYVFFVMKRAAAAHKYESFKQLKKDGVTVGRNRDYSYSPEFLAAEFEGPVYSKAEAGIMALVSGEIDLYPMDKTVGSAILQKLGLADSVTWLPKPLFTKPYLSPFCRRSKFPELEKIMSAFYRELRLIRADGTYEKIYSDSLKAIEATK